MLTRRDLGRLALAGAPALALAKPNSVVQGVTLGCQTYSFRDRSLDETIKAMLDIGFSSAELWQGHIEPKKMDREELRKWRTTASMDEFKKVREKFSRAGIDIYAYNYSFRDDFTDQEIARGFEMVKALGTKRITASSNVTTAKRVDPLARKAKVLVGMHNHSRIRPNEFARPEDFEEAMRGTSNIKINLDIGHLWGAGYDPVAFLEKHYRDIVTIHVKDKTKGEDEAKPFGQGNTPIRECLQLLKTKKLKIPAMIEYEYKGQDPVADVRACLDFMKRCLI